MKKLNGCIETMLYKNGKVQYLNVHENRLKRTIKKISEFPFDSNIFEQHIYELINNTNETQYIIRVEYNANNNKYTATAKPFNNFRKVQNIGVIDSVKKVIDDKSWIKSTNREIYDSAMTEAKKKGWDDCIILNEHGNVCESSIGNIYIRKGDTLYTPRLEDGPIDGVFRKTYLKTAHIKGVKIEEKTITIDELMKADAVYVSNSVRKIYEVNLVK